MRRTQPPCNRLSFSAQVAGRSRRAAFRAKKFPDKIRSTHEVLKQLLPLVDSSISRFQIIILVRCHGGLMISFHHIRNRKEQVCSSPRGRCSVFEADWLIAPMRTCSMACSNVHEGRAASVCTSNSTRSMQLMSRRIVSVL